MKKILAVVLAVVIVLCVGIVVYVTAFKSDNNYKDTEVSLEVTSELLSELVSTDKAVSENEEGSKATSSTSASKKNDTTKSTDTTKKGDTTKKNDTTKKQDNTTKNTTTQKKEETTKETTTEAPKKREVTVAVYLPNKELNKTKLTVKYKIEGSNDWETFKFDDPDNKGKKLDYKMVTLDGKTVINCTLGKFKGSCTVKCELEGYKDLSDNIGKLSEYDDLLELHPYSGIEILEGEDD